jgi:transcriptional regulator with XRE-family HTH domain
MSNKLSEGRQLGYQFGAKPGMPDPIWELIREERIRQNLTMEEVSQLANVASSTVSRGERGYQVWLSKTRQVAQVLGITIATITTPSGVTITATAPSQDDGAIE